MKENDDPFPRVDGTTDWVRWEIRPWYESENQIGGIILFSEVITSQIEDRKALKESQARLNFHYEVSPLAIIEWDSNFIITRWTGNSEKIFGWKESEIVGKYISDMKMIFEEDLPIVEKTMAKLTDGSTIRAVSQNRNYTKDRKVIHCVWYNSVLTDKDGKMVSIMSRVLDVTEQVEAENELREQLDELRRWHAVTLDREGRVMELKQEVNELLKQLGKPVAYPSAENG